MSVTVFPKHESYKDSGIDWIGEIPASWKQVANKHLFKLRKTQVGKRSSDYDLLSLTLGGIIKRDMENPEGKFPAEFDTYQEVRPGDFVFCHFDVEETPRTVGLSRFQGMITGAYTVYELSADANTSFLYYFYLNADTDKKLRGLYKGLRNTISKDGFGTFKTPLPPLSEQHAIALFLDEKCTKIDEAVRIKEKQIKLLRERRQILIQQAVTQGLDLNIPMKNSGMDGVGKIPAHWGVKPCRYVFRSVRRLDRDGTEQKLSVTQKSGIVPTDEMKESSTQASSFDAFQVCHPNDLVLNKYKAHLGVFWMSPQRGIITNNYTVFRPLLGAVSKYFEVLFHTSPYISMFRKTVYGVTEGMMPLYTGDFYGLPAICPPEEEQIAILDHLALQGSKFIRAISIKKNQIDALKEYKSTLINAAVTGKIKVI